MDIIRKDRCPDDTPDRNQREIKLFPEVNPHSRRVLNNLPCCATSYLSSPPILALLPGMLGGGCVV
jgi:hypothetical protein